MSLRTKAFLKQQDKSLAQTSRLHWPDVMSQAVLEMLSKNVRVNRTSLKNHLHEQHMKSSNSEVREAIEEAIENLEGI